MSKNKKTKWYCIECGCTEINHKQMDGLHCPKCNKGSWIGKLVKVKK